MENKWIETERNGYRSRFPIAGITAVSRRTLDRNGTTVYEVCAVVDYGDETIYHSWLHATMEEADEMYQNVCSLIGGDVFRIDRPVDHMVTARVRY